MIERASKIAHSINTLWGRGNMLITIVTVVRNDKKNMTKTFESIVSQTYEDIEYVIKDGLSDDGTSELIQRLISNSNFKNIKYINCRDTGIYDAMNQATQVASGEWILYMNCGDYFFDRNVVKSVFSREVDEYGMICGDTLTVYNGQKGVWKPSIDSARGTKPCCHQSCFLRTEFMKEYPFDLRYRISADYNNSLDYYRTCQPILCYDNFISVFSLDGLSANVFLERLNEDMKMRKEHGYQDALGTKILKYLCAGIKEFLHLIVPDTALGKIKRRYVIKKYGSFER